VSGDAGDAAATSDPGAPQRLRRDIERAISGQSAGRRLRFVRQTSILVHVHPALPEMRRLKLLEEENAKLKKIVADLSLDREMLQAVIRRKL
jgi:hypothetical protein